MKSCAKNSILLNAISAFTFIHKLILLKFLVYHLKVYLTNWCVNKHILNLSTQVFKILTYLWRKTGLPFQFMQTMKWKQDKQEYKITWFIQIIYMVNEIGYTVCIVE